LNSVAVLQARTNSSRLPGKVLLPINGVPLVVLAAKRAANTGRQVVVATSNEPSDDGLTAIVEQYGLSCFRGSLENTLKRIVDALSEYDDKTIVFRLTADNVFPDGALLDEIEQEFIAAKLDYMCCNGELSGLPYGLSAEVTRLGHLREALKDSVSAYEQEHVTPYVVNKFGRTHFSKYKYLNKGHYRCTIDCLDDYLCVRKIFSSFNDSIHVSPFELMAGLEGADYQPSGVKAVTRLVLGTAQLGIDYGIANIIGKPNIELSQKLIKTAVANGVEFLDTAHAYGNSEEVIGQSLLDGWQGRAKIITKLSPLVSCPEESTFETVKAFVDSSIFQSCSKLRMQSLDVLMLHRASHLYEWNGAVWNRLLELKQAGTLKALGVSVQSPEELKWALAEKDVSFIQMPINILDWRWEDCVPGILTAKATRGLTIHVRSALLQGLLVSNNPALWRKANVEQAEVVIKWLQDQVKTFGRINTVDLCISYLSALDWVDGIVVGLESLNQLFENIKIFCNSPIGEESLARIKASRPILDEATLNPVYWR
jgi:spore coat polysaccharide biosynthesis protein SpsF (cytidylyltransferase family)/aryl-alcohol dehydrogenase-like predicted oxidoreductase